jgi:hypothetical protein
MKYISSPTQQQLSTKYKYVDSSNKNVDNRVIWSATGIYFFVLALTLLFYFNFMNDFNIDCIVFEYYIYVACLH